MCFGSLYHCEDCIARGFGGGRGWGIAGLPPRSASAPEPPVRAGAMHAFLAPEDQFRLELKGQSPATATPPRPTRPALNATLTARHRARRAAQLRDAARGTRRDAFVPSTRTPAPPPLPAIDDAPPGSTTVDDVSSDWATPPGTRPRGHVARKAAAQPAEVARVNDVAGGALLEHRERRSTMPSRYRLPRRLPG